VRSVDEVEAVVEKDVCIADIGVVLRENVIDVVGSDEVFDGDGSTVWLVLGVDVLVLDADDLSEVVVGSCVELSTTSVALAFAKLDMASLKTESALFDAVDSVLDIVALC